MIRQRLKDGAILLMASGFGAGYSPQAPGTLGTLTAVPLYLLASSFLPWWAYAALLFPFIVLCCVVAHRAEIIWAQTDCPKIVIDEWAGFLVAMVGIPASWATLIPALVLFRLFDIIKPFPIRWLERRLSGGLGVVADDVAAGIYALLIMHVLIRWMKP